MKSDQWVTQESRGKRCSDFGENQKCTNSELPLLVPEINQAVTDSNYNVTTSTNLRHSLPLRSAEKKLDAPILTAAVVPILNSPLHHNTSEPSEDAISETKFSSMASRRSSCEEARSLALQKSKMVAPFGRRLSGTLMKQIQMFEALNNPQGVAKNMDNKSKSESSNEFPKGAGGSSSQSTQVHNLKPIFNTVSAPIEARILIEAYTLIEARLVGGKLRYRRGPNSTSEN
jgi:hypothetical protein